MHAVGIESIHAYAGPTCIRVRDLFVARGLDLSRFDNLAMFEKSMALPCEDAVSYAVNAAKPLIDALDEAERGRIEMVITVSESPVDFGKSLSTYVHDLLDLNRNCRLIEVKQACYGGVAALQIAAAMVQSGFSPGAKVLVICTDIARATARNTYAEPTQAAGAVAMLISDRPRLLRIDPGASGRYSYEIMDVCRPQAELETGDPDLSLLSFLDCLEHSFRQYAEQVSDVDFRTTFDYFAFHTPFAGMVKGAHRRMMRVLHRAPADEIEADFERRLAPSLRFCVRVGNIYAGTVFLALYGLLSHRGLPESARVGMFSYGSGCSSEFFSGLVPGDAPDQIEALGFASELDRRVQLSPSRYDELLDLNAEWKFGISDKRVDIESYKDLYEAFFEGRGLLTLTNIDTYHREYVWS
ncbi:hydroxymethylglutaryl-CoA synthase family protein [Pseudenhygromyxa sp. WMMC2535]|uniref:hydroxymethylglutaryl-CoA synthase family protein n=1 Tax=Pseudenhygromyxa sp. WMMC2535 TaxID=2712867 RepID=UPI0015548933|nr:hydroxymethylglutaryl-CoA synthase family protein [Pseudenhygromyxa sp. WMMC2535]NVB40710.1 hydroxymethylglutaryl-CoA synthase family protein [Pseudenhygromyxa sp. WMMC2535]